MKIDAHQHFWRYNPAEFDWIDDSQQSIRRDFLPTDLTQVITPVGVAGVVSVQARQSLAETTWLLELADQHDFIKGVVGWLPLAAPQFEIPAHSKLKGVRHVVQAEPAGFLLRDDFNRGVARLRAHNLVYDILIVEHQLPEAIQFVDRHPQQVFMLDHSAKPRIRDNALEPWRRNLRELARRENVYCKLSGLVTEADYRNWTEVQLQPYFDTVLAAFGPRRLLFGSDWPVCLVACEYAQWHGIVQNFAGAAATQIMGGTAMEVYRL